VYGGIRVLIKDYVWICMRSKSRSVKELHEFKYYILYGTVEEQGNRLYMQLYEIK
jgi:hypothetical protein